LTFYTKPSILNQVVREKEKEAIDNAAALIRSKALAGCMR